jgi:hypothetical protein
MNLEAAARTAEIRGEILQQLTSGIFGTRESLPPDGHGTPDQPLWHSPGPTYGAGQLLLPAGLPAEVLHPDASYASGLPLASLGRDRVELSASERQRMTVGQESIQALAHGPPDRRTIFAG